MSKKVGVVQAGGAAVLKDSIEGSTEDVGALFMYVGAHVREAAERSGAALRRRQLPAETFYRRP